MTTATINTNNTKTIGMRELLRDVDKIRRYSATYGTTFLVESKGKPTLQISAIQSKKKKYNINDLMNFRITGKKLPKNLSRNMDKYIYGI